MKYAYTWPLVTIEDCGQIAKDEVDLYKQAKAESHRNRQEYEGFWERMGFTDERWVQYDGYVQCWCWYDDDDITFTALTDDSVEMSNEDKGKKFEEPSIKEAR